MELLIVSSEDPEAERCNWDIDVVDGVAAVVPDGAEEDQEASIIAYLEKSTIPLMEEKGVDWTGYLTKRTSLAEIDTQIRENLKTYLDNVMYTPTYTPVEGKLVVNMAKLVINTGA